MSLCGREFSHAVSRTSQSRQPHRAPSLPLLLGKMTLLAGKRGAAALLL